MSRRGANAHQFETNSRVSLIARFFSLLLFSLLVSACGETPSGDLITVDVRNGVARQTLPSLPTTQSYLVAPFSAPDSTAAGRQNYSVQMDLLESGGSAETISLSELIISPDTRRLIERIRRQEQRNSSLAEFLKEAWEMKNAAPWLFQAYFENNTIRKDLTRTLISGNIDLYSPFDEETNTPISGTLRAYSDEVAIYVDTRDNEEISEDQIQTIMTAYADISLPRLETLFGQPSDVDGNNRVHLFLASKERFRSNELGFFRPLDLLPDGASASLRSNQQEIVYTHVPSEEVPIELVHATLAHETFHLINFATKTLPLYNDTGGLFYITEDLWLNEGQAHLAEELVGWGVDTPLLIQIYLECLEHTSLAGDGSSTVEGASFCEVVSQGDSLPRRGGAMLFLLYLFQQAGGANYSATEAGDISGAGVDFLRSLNSSSKTGISNIENATGKSFFELYRDYAALLALDNTEFTESPSYHLWPEISDPFTEITRNIRLRSSRISALGEPVLLEGPILLKDIAIDASKQLNGNLFVSGINFVRVSIPPYTQVDLTFEGTETLALGVNLTPIN